MNNLAANWGVAVLWLYGTFIVLWAVQWWLGRHIQGLALLLFGRPGPASNLYFFMLAPGVIIHELSHWLFAKLLFVPTKDVSLFRPQRQTDSRGQTGPITLGYVEVFQTDPLRQSLIGLAPLPIGIAVLLGLAAVLNFYNGGNSLVPETTSMWRAITALPGEVVNSFRQPINILWLYLVFTVSNGMLPSRPDRRPWLIGFILPGTVLLILAATGTLPPLPTDWQQTLWQLLGNLTWIFAFAAAINLTLALIIFLLEALLSRLRRRRVVYK